MRLRHFLRKTSKKASPIAVHLCMILGVALYTIFGAIVMQKLESPSAVESQADGSKSAISRRALHAKESELDESPKALDDNGIDIKKTIDANQIMRSRKCVIKVLKRFSHRNCTDYVLRQSTIQAIDQCYHIAVSNQLNLDHLVFKHSSTGMQLVKPEAEFIEPWSFTDAVLFTFTIITTIGYGNVAPRTFGGRLFCICYGLVGVPFALLAIADLGKFISEILESWEKAYRKFYRQLERRWVHYRNTGNFSLRPQKFDSSGRLLARNTTTTLSRTATDGDLSLAEKGSLYRPIDSSDTTDHISSTSEDRRTSQQSGSDDTKHEEKEEDDDDEEEEEYNHKMALLIMFIIYIFGGAFLLASYEPDMTLFKAIYFNFVSLTSIGLGDVVPQSETYMVLTLLYIAIGLALTTIAIEIFADTLKKLHYFGRKIENVGNVVIWFGGKSITMKALVKNLGDQFNLPTTTIKTLDLDTFVDNAIKVEEGELETLRPAPIEPEDLELEEMHYADDEEEMWIPQKTPSPKDPTPEPEPDPVPTPTFTCREPTPPIEKEPETAREPTPPQPDTAREPTPDESTYEEDKRKAYSEEAWRRYQEYQKQWRKFRQTSSNATVVRRESSSTSPNVERGASITSSTGLEPFSPSSTPFLSSSPSTSKVTKPTKKRRF